MKKRAKFSLSASMFLLALMTAAVQNWTMERCTILFATVMAFTGDMFLLVYGSKTKKKDMRMFVLGMVCFIVTHLLYAISFGGRRSDIERESMALGMIVGLFVSAFFIYLTLSLVNRKKKKHNKLLYRGCLIYAVIIATSTAIIYGYSFAAIGKFCFLAAFGITSFLASDCLIAIRELLKIDRKKIDKYIWLLYIVGQSLLIIA